jgi:hypothetical protein
MRRILVIISLLFLSFRPGEAIGILTCKDRSGKVIFEATLPSLSYLESANLHLVKGKVGYSVDDHVRVSFNPRKKSFILILTSSNAPAVQVNAISNSFRVIKDKKGPGTQFSRLYRFKGKLKVAGETETTLDCRLEYEL